MKFKRRRQKSNRQLLLTQAFLVLLLFIGIGYSVLESNLGILGNVRFKKYVPQIYWALQDNDSDSINETLVLSSE